MRVKTGVVRHRKHRTVLKMAKGYRMSRRRLIKTAKEALLHAGEYAFAGRKQKKRNFRSLWITRINSATRSTNMTYGKFINALKQHNVEIDRKILSKLAVEEPEIFQNLVTQIQK